METPNKIVMMNVADLSYHPTAELTPMHPKDHREYRALLESIRENGIHQALLVDGENRVIDGRHRLRAARECKKDTVPCVVMAEDRGAEIVMETALSRRQFNESQRAILIAQLFPMTAAQREANRLANLSNRVKKPEILETLEKHSQGAEVIKAKALLAKHVAERYAVDTDTLQRAYRILDHPPAARDAMVYSVMVEGHGVGGVLAGKAGKDSTDGKTKRPHNYFKHLDNGLRALKKFGAGFEKIEDARMVNKLVHLAEEVPAHLPDELRRALARGLKRVAKSAKGGQR